MSIPGHAGTKQVPVFPWVLGPAMNQAQVIGHGGL
jgi:hypothetical protein